MKQLSTIFLLLAIATLNFSCKKQNDETPNLFIPCETVTNVPDFHSPCETVLKDWSISSSLLPWGYAISAFFPTDEIGYIVGNQGMILKTTDGGGNWEILEQYYSQSNGFDPNAITTAQLNSVYFVDDVVGYAGGVTEKTYTTTFPVQLLEETDAVWLKTTDGGSTWEKHYLLGAINISALHFFDAQNGIAIADIKATLTGTKTKIMSTSNGGIDWVEKPVPVNITRLQILASTPTSLKLRAVDNTGKTVLLSSYDNGQTWQQADAEVPSSCVELFFVDDEIGFAHCWDSLEKTTDGGNSWKTIQGPMCKFELVHFNTANDGFVINEHNKETSYGDAIETELLYYDVYQTHDGGENWKKYAIDKDCNYFGYKVMASKGKFFTLGINFNKFEKQ